MIESYQICSKCVMDTTDIEITFDEKGVCSHCYGYEEIKKNWPLKEYIKEGKLESLFFKIKNEKKRKKYDCIIGLSGGVDSSYVAFLAHKYALNPLCVHLDNGWNAELATHNINNIVKKFNFDLYTHVINWREFRSLQRAFFKADVVDLELLSDHAIFGVIIQIAKRHSIKYILSGANIVTEAIMPKTWVHRKQDLKNIIDINKKFGERELKTFPMVSTLKHVFFMYGLGYKVIKPLNYINFNKENIKKLLKKEIGWRDYGGKHYESLFTKFYQAYILPQKFNIDKRKAHLSTLINSSQITREDALEKLKQELYSSKELIDDKDFVLKKLNFTEAWFKEYLKRPRIEHSHYKSDQFIYNILNYFRHKLNL